MKQVFEANTKLRRVICAVLVAIMVFAMIPLNAPKAEAVGANQTLYFQPNNAAADDAWFGACFHNGSGDNNPIWERMVSDGQGKYYCTVPNGKQMVSIVRFAPYHTEMSWSKFWNQTNDLNLNEGNCFVVNNFDGRMYGYWTDIADVVTPSQPTETTAPSGTDVIAYLAGEMNSWSTSATPLLGSGNVGSVTVNLKAGTYKFKIFGDDGWRGNGGEINDNGELTIPENGSDCVLKATGGTYTFTFNKSTNKIVVSRTGGGGGETTPTTPSNDVKLYVGTTFYDYRSDRELNGTELKNVTDQFEQGKDWYIFHKFNKALSDYYSAAAPGASESNPSKLVPIYMGHFQPEWDNDYWWYVNQGKPLFGFKDGKAYRNDGDTHNTKDQMYFMSVNNSIMNVRWEGNAAKPWGGQTYKASWGIVGDTLVGNQLMAANSNVAMPFFNETFLNQKYNNRTYGVIYNNVQFPFTKEDPDKNGIEYWVFDSDDTTLEMKQDATTSQYYLSEVTSNRDAFKNKDHTGNNHSNDTYGFFPFNSNSNNGNTNTYNYGFGMRLDIPFNLTSDGKLADKYGDKQDIIFKFSGDDDVWVFIDGILVLDIGGCHSAVDGEINFATMTSTVSGVKASGGNIAPADADNNKEGYQTTFELDKPMAGEHTLTMFYMERGMWESNMSISFNFIPKSSLWEPTTSFTVQKQWNIAMDSQVPSSAKVQLQRRVEGTTDWEAVDTFELTSANAISQRVANVWQYTWTDLDNFTDESKETLYEYRAVELGSDNNVLANGEFGPDGMMVSYGEVAGNGGQGYMQIISNNQVENNIVVVIDFGLSVDVTVVDDDKGTLVGIGNTLKLPVGGSDELDEYVCDKVDGKHGVATVVTVDNVKKIRYTPNDMMMDSADNIGFCLSLNDSEYDYNYSTLTVIPAANIYYEDSFLSFNDYEATPDYSYGQWESVKDKNYKDGDKTQEEDRPEFGNDYDADNVYGYDQAYDNYTLYSLGSAMKVTVDKTAGFYNTAPTATFTFTGTGFDVISLTDNDSGALFVEVRTDEDSDPIINYVVNNYYGMKYENGEWHTQENDDGNCLYQIPVIKVDCPNYGTYHVTIRAAYLASQDMTNNNGNYTLWVDAIRIYNPAQNDKTSNDAYLDDGESNPHLTTVKKLLTTPNSFGNGYGANGVIFVEGKSEGVTMTEYKNQGPNNETYLKGSKDTDGQNGIAFKLRYNGNHTPNVALQIGAKLAVGSQATLVFNGENLTTLKTATNMFYKLEGISWTEKTESGQTFYESSAIVLSCVAGSGDILSLTDLKLTGADADEIWDYYNPESTEPAMFMAVVDNEVFNFAVDVMSAVEANPVTLTGKSFSLSFEDEILVNYYYAISDVTNVTEHGMLVFNTDPGAADIAKADQKYDAPVYVESENLYACTTSGIAAKEMGDTRYYCAYAKLADGTIVYSDLSQYSPKHYAMSRLENSENENLKALCVAMLNYGAAAQSYFGYKTDALMNADLTDAQKALVGEYNADLFTGAVAADPAKVNGCFASTEAGFEQISASVSFEGAFALNFYFDLDRENSEVVFYYWTKEAYDSADELSDTNCTGSIAATADANGIFYAPITGIAAKELDDTIYVAATYTIDGETFCSGVIAYSLSTYCMRHANGNMGQLAQATAMYGYYAENYFGVSSQELI